MKYKDQLGNFVDMDQAPKRIISLVPSQTEFLFDLGLDEEIVGITRYCIHPKEKCLKKTKVGGTKKLDHQLIDQLKPDLIIGNKEENIQKDIESLKTKYPVWMSDVVTLDDAYKMMLTVGEMVGRKKQAEELIEKIKEKFFQLAPMVRQAHHVPSIVSLPGHPDTSLSGHPDTSLSGHPDTSLSGHPEPVEGWRVVYFIWKNPYMAVGQKTFIHEMLKICGFKNLFENQERYPEVTLEQIKNLKPDIIILSTEPYPFTDKDVDELSKEFPNSRVMLVDGEIFSWYGSRLLLAADYFKKIIKELDVRV